MRSKTLWFSAVAIVLAWLVASPAWLNGRGLSDPLLVAYAALMMFTPTLAVLVVWLVSRLRGGQTFRELARETGLGLGPRKGRTVAIFFAVWLGVPVLVALTLLLSALVGVAELDLAGHSGLRKALEATGAGTGDLGVTAIAMLVTMPLAAFITMIPAFGEEWGWRGWLLPRLMRYGTLRAVLISGVIWGVWHAPLTLLGYNYPNLGPWAALMFVPICVALGALLSWARLATGSVWPAVMGHAIFNDSSATLNVLGSDAASPLNPVLASSGGVLAGVLYVAVALLLFRLVRPRSDAPLPADPALIR